METFHMQRTALLVIDVQVALIDGTEPSHNKSAVLANIASLLHKARTKQIPVIYMQHIGSEQGLLTLNAPGWQIHPQVAPIAGEMVLSKRASDSFYATPLQEQLEAWNITHLLITGCRTQFCVDTTSRRAISLGYDVTLVSDAHTTVDSETLTAAQIVAHHNETLDDFGTDEHAIVLKPALAIAF